MMSVDFKETELHVRIDRHIEDADHVKLAFFHEKHFHEMQRPLTDSLQKSLRRMAKTIEKGGKSKKKTKRSGGRATEEAECDALAEDVGALVLDGVPVVLDGLANTDFQTGMRVNIAGLSLGVVVNPPTISHLSSFPRAHYTVGYPIVPVVDFDYATHYHCHWMHELVAQSGEYELVSTDLVFTPGAASIGRRIKLLATPFRDECDSRVFGRSVVFYLSNYVKQFARCPIPRAVQLREDFYSSRPVASSPSATALRIMTYNVLSEGYAQKEQAASTLYWYCEPRHLELEFRGQLVAKELLTSNADIVGLQECDRKLFDSYLLPLMGHAGYDGHFTNKVAMVQEGCALFTRREVLTVVDFVDVPLKNILQRGQSAQATALYDTRPDLEDILGGKLGTVAQIVVAKIRGAKDVLCVANTHLFYHPLASYLRLLQVAALTSCLEALCGDVKRFFDAHPDLVNDHDSSAAYLTPRRLSSYFQEHVDPHFLKEELRLMRLLVSLTAHGRETDSAKDFEVVPRVGDDFEEVVSAEVRDLMLGGSGVQVSTVILGDLNSSPRSAAFSFLRSGAVTDEHLRHSWPELQRFFWGSCVDEPAAPQPSTPKPRGADGGPLPASVFKHSLPLQDACAAQGYEVVSNYTPGFQELLDYIFVDRERHHVLGIAPMPSAEVMTEETALPSSCFPSDHVSVVVDIEVLR